LKQIDPAIKKETVYIALVVLILSALMESVYLIIGRWDLSVLFGNLLGASAGILNFFFMGLGLQNALGKDSKQAKTTVSFSHTMRYLMMAAVIVIAFLVEPIGLIPAIISLVFPTVGIFMRTFMIKKVGKEEVEE